MADRLSIDGEDLEKYSRVLPISQELAMDYGLIPDPRPPRKPIPRWTRFRWWLSAHRPVLHFGDCNHDDCY